MKYFILGLVISLNCTATTLTQFLSTPNGNSEQIFLIVDKKVTFEKRSNFFDKKRSYSLGNFHVDSGKIKSTELKQLDRILKKITSVDEFLKKKNSSFNELSAKDPHASFLLLNDFHVSKKSDLYPDLKSIFDRMQAYKWKQKSGIKLSDDLRSIILIEGGKEIKKEAFNFAFHCKEEKAPTYCLYKDLGIIYVQ